MKKNLKPLFGLFVLFLFSCTQDELYQDSTFIGDEEITKITAVISAFDDVDTRTSFTTGEYPTNPNPVWAEGDSLGIYPDVGDQLSFRINTGGGSNCTFTGGGWALKASSSYTAYYPFKRSYYYEDKTSLSINMVGQTQNGNDNSDHWGAYDYQIAKGKKPESGSLIFEFERKVALVRMELKAPCAASWKSITLESTATFTTKAKMNLSLETPTITATAQSNSVTLNLKNVQTTADDLDIIAYMMLLPVDFTGKSLSVKLTDVDDNIYTAEATFVNNKTNYAANSARWIRADFGDEVVPTIPYVTFSADAPQTLTMSNAVETLEYSVNGSEWETLGTTVVAFGGKYGELRLRGMNRYGTTRNDAVNRFIFGNITPVACTGDIRTLIDYKEYDKCYTGDADFAYLFYNCTSLTSAPALPSTTLAEYCYLGMFSGCTSLTEAPVLPATTLSVLCYAYMFDDCSSLTEAPALPATTLAGICYEGMFRGCTSLTSAPALPATTLVGSCYAYMFLDCSSLTSASALPATTLAGSCYKGMFSGCTSLTEAPALPVVTLAKSCYSDMFYGCTSLVEAPALPADILTPDCYSHMFHGCTNLKSAPSLPSVLLAKGCYSCMFLGCTSLTEAPTLPSTILAPSCYSGMFGGCTSLTAAPTLPATMLAENCYGVTGCADGMGMFEGCIGLTETPQLLATTLAINCYKRMFFGCSSLKNVTMVATDVSASGCLTDWLDGVNGEGTFTKAAEMTTLPTGSSGIPSGWTVENYIE